MIDRLIAMPTVSRDSNLGLIEFAFLDQVLPRANHRLKAADGKATLSGGYAYTSTTDYCGGQYKDVGDGEWVYDLAADEEEL